MARGAARPADCPAGVAARSTSSPPTTCSRRSCAPAAPRPTRASSPGCPSGPAAQLLGVLRPDALAGVRVGRRTLALFLERDLGTERGEVLADKVRRYRSVFSRAPGDAMAVGFVVASDRRAQTIHAMGRRQPGGLTLLTVVADQLLVDPLGATWLDGQQPRSIRELAAAGQDDGPILAPGCLLDAERLPPSTTGRPPRCPP